MSTQSYTITIVYSDRVSNGSASIDRSGRRYCRSIAAPDSLATVQEALAELASWTDDVRVQGIESIAVVDDLAERVRRTVEPATLEAS